MEKEQHDPKGTTIQDLDSPMNNSYRSSPSMPMAAQSAFQKNYPKNIFIPIIQYLADIGLQTQYEECAGTREKFEGKNVVSLGLIHRVITQSWFLKRVDRKVLLANLTNKIMMNSKIKKKLFHLRVAKSIIELPTMEAKEFKKKVSRNSNLIALQCKGISDQIFQAPNSIIYLLRLFVKVLNNRRQPQYEMEKENSTGSKEQYKHLVKQISSIINRKSFSYQSQEVYETVKKTILEREESLRIKFNFPQGVPNWDLFIKCVVDMCFQYKKLQTKVTNSGINDWINQFRLQSTSAREAFEDQNKWYGAKVFEPIIIHPPFLQ